MSFLYVERGPNGITPTRSSCKAAGYDLYSSIGFTLLKNSSGLIPTDIKISCPNGTYGRIASRSGLALRHGLDVAAGVIDPDFRGAIMVLMRNTSDEDYHIQKGDRVAQIILEKYAVSDIIEVKSLDTTCRGVNGFGSSGK